ncbi:hypothetical protein FFW75_15645, partial [Escherichia coli]|nr:hypothetical protein [Escherichia coli]
MKAEDMIRMSESWLKKIIKKDGTISFDPNDDSFRLRKNGIIIHELDFDRLMASIISTSITLAIPSQNGGIAPNLTIVDKDHDHIWGWCAEFVKFMRVCSRSIFVEPLMELFLTCSYAACMPPVQKNGFITSYIDKSHFHLSYLAMPLLEGVAKRFCEDFIDMDGKVKQPFEKLNGKFYKVNDKCSSIGDLLLLVHNRADEQLKGALTNLNGIVETYNPMSKAYYTIKDWRNSSLHGSQNYA